MQFNRRSLLLGFGGSLALPLLESQVLAGNTKQGSPMRLLIVGNPLGMHPEHFFPKEFGPQFNISPTLASLEWMKDRLTIVSHTDHGMASGHGKEISFLNGILPASAGAFPERNVSLDQLCAQQVGSQVRYDCIGASLGSSTRMSWTANGVDRAPFTDPQKLFDYLFQNLTPEKRAHRHDLLRRDGSILDSVADQFAKLMSTSSARDRDRLDQFQTAVRELEVSIGDRETWLDRDKPAFDISEYFSESEVTIANRYDAIFDMIGYAFQTDLTRVATIGFPRELSYTDIDGVRRSYHSCTHNGKSASIIAELVAIESFQIECLSRCLKKLDSIKEPNSDGTMLDHTIVLFGSGMGYGGTHSNRNLPIMVAGGGFKHRGHVDAASRSGTNMPLCNLFVTLMQQFGIERDRFNTSSGRFDLENA